VTGLLLLGSYVRVVVLLEGVNAWDREAVSIMAAQQQVVELIIFRYSVATKCDALD